MHTDKKNPSFYLCSSVFICVHLWLKNGFCRIRSTRGIVLVRLFGFADLFHPLGDSLLHASVGGKVVLPAGERRGKTFHPRNGVLELVRVLVSGAVSPLLHRRGGRIAEMHRHR